MGGKAFPNYSAPRLPTALYERLLTSTVENLRPLYTHVGSPVPGPGKKDHGDIDIIVVGPIFSSDDNSVSRSRLYANLHAVKSKTSGPITSYLIPLSSSDVKTFGLQRETAPVEPHYVQVDVHFTISLATYDWLLFTHSHGDLFNILGTMIRPFGLTITDTGLYIRLVEMEAAGEGKRARIFVTSSTQRCWEEVFGFPSWTTFATAQWSSLEAMYAVIVRCRFFLFSSFIKETTLTAHDRSKMKKRDGFKQFVESFLPALQRNEPKFEEKGKRLTRDFVWREIMDKFKEVREEAERKKCAWRKEQERIKSQRRVREVRKDIADEEERYRDAWMNHLISGP